MSKIEWTGETDNPITVKGDGHWCRKISEGCANCYAETINTGNRFDFASGLTYTGEAPELELNRKMLEGWARKRVPKRRFVCSMTDWCGEWIGWEWQFAMLDAMAAATKQTFMLLTKRADVLNKVVTEWLSATHLPEVPEHIWLGVSIENQRTADARISPLLNAKIANRFLSCEPLLDYIDLDSISHEHRWETGQRESFLCWNAVNPLDGGAINLVIVGAESGKGARPMDEDWVRSLRDEVKGANKAFFYKQKAVNGRKTSLPKLDGKEWSELP